MAVTSLSKRQVSYKLWILCGFEVGLDCKAPPKVGGAQKALDVWQICRAGLPRC